MIKDDIDYESIVKLLNNIFINADEDISKSIFDNYKIKTRKTKLSFKDALIYSLEYTQNNKTKIDIVNKFNKDIDNYEKKISRTTFHEKVSNIPLSYYADVHKKLLSIYKNKFNKSKPSITAVDGTYGNTNVKNIKGYLETSLSMGFFDVTNEIPIELIFKGEESKNKELISLQNYIIEHKNELKNTIFVLDRAYCSYHFIDFCFKNQIKYVVRFRNNCIDVSKKKNRMIKFDEAVKDVVQNDNIDKHLINNKKFSSVTLKTKNEYTLITNLDINDYNDEKIKEIYHQRWNIEVFFKIIKHNFKFSDIKITSLKQNNDNYSIHNIKILIIYLLGKIMEKVHLHVNKIKLHGIIKKRIFKNKTIKNNNVIKKEKKITKKQQNELNNIPIINTDITDNKKIIIEDEKQTSINKNNNKNSNNINKDNNERECILKPCITDIIKGVFELIHDIITGKLTLKTYSNVANQYIKYYKIDPTINNKRICKTPFKKWYIKGYTNKSDNVKIVNFILGFSTKKLNKNLIVKLNNSTIVKINYVKEVT